MVTPELATVKLPFATTALFTVAEVAVKPVIPVAFAVQPVVIIKMSPVAKSVIASVPLLTLKVSFPVPPVNESLPAPPVILSFSRTSYYDVITSFT